MDTVPSPFLKEESMEKNQGNLPAVIQAAIKTQGIDLAQVNLMLPTQSFGAILGEFDRVSLEVVTIDPNPEKGDVAIIGGKKALCRPPIDRIGAALGIIWDPAQTGIIESTDRKSRAKATGALHKPNGEWIVLSEEKTVDMDVFEDEQRANLSKKVSGAELEMAVAKSMLQYRKFKDERAMTGARLRCVKALIGLKAAFTDAELSRPFAFPRVTFDSNKALNSPELRQQAIERGMGAVGTIFGNGNGKSRPEKIEDAQVIHAEPEDCTEPAANGNGNGSDEPKITLATDDDSGDDLFPETKPKPEDEIKVFQARIRKLLENEVIMYRPDGTARNDRVNGEKWLSSPDAQDIKKLIETKDKIMQRIVERGGQV
jgi:hypothetical protein